MAQTNLFPRERLQAASEMGAAQSATLSSFGIPRLRRLLQITGIESDEYETLFRQLLGPRCDDQIAHGPQWPSDVCDDGTPFEFSLAFTPRPVLRVMTEPIAIEPSLSNNAALSLQILEELARSYAVSLSRVKRVWDLFVPKEPQGHFSVWLAAELANEEPSFKLYLNPEARGPSMARATVEECCRRLGLASAWPLIAKGLSRGRAFDEIRFVSLDLAPTAARLKIYTRHHNATAEVLEVAASVSQKYRSGQISEFLEQMAPGQLELAGRSPWTCLAFVEGESDPTVTSHFPINGYVENDAQSIARTAECLRSNGIAPTAYVEAMAALAPGPSDAVAGTQSYCSLRTHPNEPRLTVYLPPAAFRPQTIAAPTAPKLPDTSEAILQWFETVDSIEAHPVLCRLRGESVSSEFVDQFAMDALRRLIPNLIMHTARAIAAMQNGPVVTELADLLESLTGQGDASRSLQRRLPIQAEARRLPSAEPPRFSDPQALLGWTTLQLLFTGEVSGCLAAELKRVGNADAAFAEELQSLTLNRARAIAAIVVPAGAAAFFQGANRAALSVWRLLDELSFKFQE